MVLTAQAAVNKLQALITSDGNLPLELHVEIVDVNGKAHMLSALAHSILVKQNEAQSPVIVISTNDLAEA